MMRDSKDGGEGDGSQLQSNRIDGGMNEQQQMLENEFQTKRQYIEDLRKRLLNAQEENQFMQQELAGLQQMQEGQQMDD